MEEKEKNKKNIENIDKIEKIEHVENLRVIPEICDLKHKTIDKNISDIKEDINKMEKSILEGLDKKQASCRRESDKDYYNLKDKIICSVKGVNLKIDSLFGKFNQLRRQLDGNGEIGLHENVRSIKKSIKWMWVILAIFIILELGGSYSGVTLESIRVRFFGKENQQIEYKDENNESYHNIDEVPNIDINIIDKK